MTPFNGPNRVTSIYGPRQSPLTGAAEQHRGQDIVPTNGDWTVRECTGGTVVRVADDAARGKYVDVQTAPRVFQRYQHMQAIVVSVGQGVPQGTPLGTAGSSGAVTGRHLHFGVYKNGTAEACAVPCAAFSGVPNSPGVHPGNNTLDAPLPAACACGKSQTLASTHKTVSAALATCTSLTTQLTTLLHTLEDGA